MHVLVVDDEPDARELLGGGARASRRDRDHASAASPRRFAALDAEPPDVIVSDIGMPGADGYELVRRLRALPDDERRQTPAVALTGFARPEDGARAAAAGFDAHVAKPVEPLALVAVVERAVHGGGSPASRTPLAEASA